MTKGARCTNYGECQIADTGKKVNAAICPECKRPTVSPKKSLALKGGKPGLLLVLGFIIVGGALFFGVPAAWDWFQTQRLAEFLDEEAVTGEASAQGEGRQRGSRNPQGMPEGMAPPSWWQRVLGLPSDGDMRRALQRELKPGVKMKKFKLVAQKNLGGGKFALEYEVTARIERAVFTVTSKKAASLPGRKLDAEEQDLLKDLVLAPNLPPGQIYDWDHKEVLENPTESAIFSWNVSEAEKIDGRWLPVAWEPFPMEKHHMSH